MFSVSARLRAMKRTAFCGALVVLACGTGGQEGQGVKTPDQLVADQEQIEAEQERKHPASAEPTSSAGETDMEKKKKFDHRQAEMELKRAARSAATCVGVVSDDSPHGATKVSLIFGNDGHVKSSSIPAPFDGTPIGKCAQNAMNAVIVPSFVGPDENIDWDIDLSAPEEPEGAKKKKGKKP